MRYTYAIVMAVVAGALLLYALLLQTGDKGAIPYRSRHTLPTKDTKGYIKRLGKILAVVALAPLVSALAGLIVDPEITVIPHILAPVIGFPLCLWLGIKLFYVRP